MVWGGVWGERGRCCVFLEWGVLVGLVGLDWVWIGVDCKNQRHEDELD